MDTSTVDRVTVIKALAHPTRLRVAELLAQKTSCVSELHQQIGGDLSTVSKHLSIMREAGWLTCHKTGLHIHYSLACNCLDEFLRCVDSLAQDPSNCC